MLRLMVTISVCFIAIWTDIAHAKKHKKTWDYPLFYYQRYEIKGSEDFEKFRFNLRNDPDVSKELSNNGETGLISYLLYEDGEVVVDESDIPQVWQGDLIQNEMLLSNSMGKSIVSYIAGHAICQGYISDVDEKLNDWKVVENTLFHGQILRDLLNMQAGDDNYVGERLNPQTDNMLKKHPKVNVNSIHIEDLMSKYFQNTKVKKPSFNSKRPKYNYSALSTNVIMNYVRFRVGEDWESLLTKVFADHVKVKNGVYILKTVPQNQRREGSDWYQFFMTRDDYLRFAVALLRDWKSNNCVGQYLKMLYEQRIRKNDNVKWATDVGLYTKSYGGQFHFDIYGIEDRIIFGLSGFAGQQILIDLDRERILVVNSTYRNYDWETIVYDRMKN